MTYHVEADLYEGSLWLLVELAHLGAIDLFLIKLAALTESYLAQVKRGEAALDQLAEPLPLLGMLLALKARHLMPQPRIAAEEDEELPISLEELERRLKEYEQFKTVAQLLAELHALQHQRFGRPPSDTPVATGRSSEQTPCEISLTDLMGAFAKVLEKATAPLYEVRAEPWTVEMKVQELRTLLIVRRQIRFLELFTPQQSKLELVVTFLALLELMRQRLARAIQDQPFADILIALHQIAEEFVHHGRSAENLEIRHGRHTSQANS